MPTPPPAERIADDEVLTLTERGLAQLNDSRTSLKKEAIEVLVLVDGKSSVAQLTRGMPVLAPSQVRANLEQLLAEGLLRSAKRGNEGISYIDPGDFFKTIGKPVRLSETDASGHSTDAATGLASLREAGYYVRIARRAAQLPDKPAGARRVALVVDDDPDIGNLLTKFLRLEDFEVIVAMNKTEVIAALRRQQPPDLALLDVNLPDVDGFHILSRIRQHPVLKNVPVIMLTAAATRADVLKGLHFGADGYVTKPFSHDAFMKAVHTVLGLDEADPLLSTVPR